ncbi:MAG: alpha/beta fold hydrolase [Puniceicoccales bacterium]|nr:alpha/beta fold hydrolase [Puniceicoccales bacterium]
MRSLASIHSLYPFKSHYVALRTSQANVTYKLHYIDEGQGEPVVMLHGNPTWSFFYRNLVKNLNDFCRCLVPDHMGCGLSDKPQYYPYNLKTHIENTIQWLQSLSIGRFHLVVHDWGGAIGMGVATRWPARVKTLTILNSAAFLCDHIPFRIALCRLPLLGICAVKYANLFAKCATSMASVKGLDAMVKKAYLLPYQAPRERVAIHAFIQDIPMSPKHPSYETLGDIQDNLWILANKPSLFAWGMQDFCFTPYFLERWKQFLPNAETRCFDDAGHYVLEDASEEANEVIRKFIAAHQSVDHCVPKF